MDSLSESGFLQFNTVIRKRFAPKYRSVHVADTGTLRQCCCAYDVACDPHAAVVLAGTEALRHDRYKRLVVVLKTAHACKFKEGDVGYAAWREYLASAAFLERTRAVQVS